MAYRRALAQKELWTGELTSVVVDGTRILLLRVDDGVYAYEDRCAHQRARLSEGRLDGCVSLRRRHPDTAAADVVPVLAERQAAGIEQQAGDVLLARGAEMLEEAGFKNIEVSDTKEAPGLGIHEMGTTRMGKDPKTSILNSENQIWDVKNVFVTDGACMASNACQNPSLTYMALTARAANHAVELMKKKELLIFLWVGHPLGVTHPN